MRRIDPHSNRRRLGQSGIASGVAVTALLLASIAARSLPARTARGETSLDSISVEECVVWAMKVGSHGACSRGGPHRGFLRFPRRNPEPATRVWLRWGRSHRPGRGFTTPRLPTWADMTLKDWGHDAAAGQRHPIDDRARGAFGVGAAQADLDRVARRDAAIAAATAALDLVETSPNSTERRSKRRSGWPSWRTSITGGCARRHVAAARCPACRRWSAMAS